MMKKKRLEDELEKDLRRGSYVPNSQHLPTLASDRPEMNAEQLIAAHGFLSESHTVLTEDGYMLTMHRVISDNGPLYRRVVLLHHGLLGSSEDWLLPGTRALPYMLIDNGFDVWLLNARGNRYSRIHINRRPDWPNFWDFSWHEIGVYDLPATIKYITEITKSTELHFIGHSMGGTALLVLLSSMPQYNSVLKSAILLAPIAYMYHAQGPIKMLSNFYRQNGYHSLDFLGQKEFMRNEVFPEQIVKKYCKGESKSCFNPLLLFGNGGSGAWSRKLLRDILSHVPAGGSVKTVLHYVQLVRSGYFQKYDYGDVDNNMIKYRNTTPPSYNLKAITLPIALFSSPSDWLASASDIQTLLGMLRDVSIHHVVKTDNFGHFDFLWSPDAAELIYNFIIPLLDQRLPMRKPVYHIQ
ncbi:hypothetical protein PYW08_000321 [Mythimna loreyi]|uniref:Uncharacterized protein n=1 Tax=Mythimna loreyi TaxID=667449 RepID=A0ACC2RC62_9NEOP|nr:hypothetical protein PYW08_000321 [Mythimna loreyi]